MKALLQSAETAKLLALVIMDLVRPTRRDYRLPARWLRG